MDSSLCQISLCAMHLHDSITLRSLSLFEEAAPSYRIGQIFLRLRLFLPPASLRPPHIFLHCCLKRHYSCSGLSLTVRTQESSTLSLNFPGISDHLFSIYRPHLSTQWMRTQLAQPVNCCQWTSLSLYRF